MSPEQISGAPLSFASDVYALGVTAFQALTGRLPFVGPDFVSQHLGEKPPRPSALRPGLDAAWDALVARALEKAPQARFASLEELRHALTAIAVDAPAKSAATDAPAEPEPRARPLERYAPSGTLGTTDVSTLEQATDTTLGREVILERFLPSYLSTDAGAEHLRWLRALARHGGPRLQRVLRIDRTTDLAVFEAVSGRPLAPHDLPAPDRARLLEALEPLHASGHAHGAIATSVVREDFGPTLLVAGRRPSSRTPAEDRRDLE
jgi:serine/threonine-protein kinase